MKDAMQIAATGMQTQQRLVETIAHNMSNINTQGFKRSKVSFAELVAGSPPWHRLGLPSLLRVGVLRWPASGCRAPCCRLRAASCARLTKPLDLAIVGPGFLEVDLGAANGLSSTGLIESQCGRLALRARGSRWCRPSVSRRIRKTVDPGGWPHPGPDPARKRP